MNRKQLVIICALAFGLIMGFLYVTCFNVRAQVVRMDRSEEVELAQHLGLHYPTNQFSYRVQFVGGLFKMDCTPYRFQGSRGVFNTEDEAIQSIKHYYNVPDETVVWTMKQSDLLEKP